MARSAESMAKGNEDRDRRFQRFIDAFTKTNRFNYSCAQAGVGCTAVRHWLKTIPRYVEAFEHARESYAEAIQEEVHRRAVKGVVHLKSVDKEGDEHFDTLYSDSLLAMEAKRVKPEYREGGAGGQAAGGLANGRIPSIFILPAVIDFDKFHEDLARQQDELQRTARLDVPTDD